MTPKTSLTFEEKIIAVYMHYVRNISQQDVASAMGGVNIGRINEVCGDVKDIWGESPQQLLVVEMIEKARKQRA